MQTMSTSFLRMGTLLEKYQKEIKSKLFTDLGYTNVHQTPKVEKVVLNVGLGEAVSNPMVLETVSEQLAQITGQKPLITRAKSSISSFKLRAGMPIGAKVTLRGKRMYEFLEKLFTVVIPRMRDFRGFSDESFDREGNFTIGIREQILFPEIDFAQIDKIRGLQLTIVTTTKIKEEAKKLLSELGARFKN